MPLDFPDNWRFEGIGQEFPGHLVYEVLELLKQLPTEPKDRKSYLEACKSAFGVDQPSSSVSWAEADLRRAMEEKRSNAALFV